MGTPGESAASEPPPASAWLEAADGRRTVIAGSCFLGRAATNDVVLPDDRVSRRHTAIHSHAAGDFWLTDLGSANGTYLNGRRVTQPCRLNDGDRVEVASFALTFRQPAAEPRTDTDQTTEKTIQNIRSAECWLLVADVEQHTQFIRRLPVDEGPRVIGRWLADCKQVIDEHGGAINKFLGDGFLAYWPDREDADASVGRALLGLRKLQDQAPLRFRFVVHYGKVFMGAAASMGEESLMGNEVNFVFRMEKMAGTMGAACLLSETANAKLKSHLPTVEEGRRAVEGFEGEFLFFGSGQ